MRKAPVLVHKDELKQIGVDVLLIQNLTKAVQIPHRDDHYMFILQRQGSFTWELDFNQVVLFGSTVCFVIPGQVHRYIDFENCIGWLVFVDPLLIPDESREIFDTYVNAVQLTSTQETNPVFDILPVLEKILKQVAMPLRKNLIISLTETITGFVASNILVSQNSANVFSGQKRKTVIRFKHLIQDNRKKLKQVKAYADLLNITPLYLNEIVKQITGFPASYWINQEILLEAKRLLYHSTMDVKQIAYELGYEDHTYFSRFFKKHNHITPSDFRLTKPLFVQS